MKRTLVRLWPRRKPAAQPTALKGTPVSTLLHISASPRGAASESLQIASTFLERYRQAHPIWGPPLGAEFGTDFQSTYFNDWLAWTGITDISQIRYHPTLSGDADQARRAAHATA